jgi:uncharacterized protein
MPMKIVHAALTTCDKNSTIGWQGGEPVLAGLDFYKRAVGYRQLNHSLQTNATLINREWAQFLAANNFLVGVSIDGDRDTHNKYRGGWDETVRGIRLLQEENVSITAMVGVYEVSEGRGRSVYQTITGLGINYIQFIPIVRPPIFSNLCYNTNWGVFLIDAMEAWLEDGFGRVGVQNFEDCAVAYAGYKPQCCVHNKLCGGLVVEADGDVFACEHFIPQHRLGNILRNSWKDLTRSWQFKRFQDIKLPSGCRKCAYFRLCYGGCKAHRTGLKQTGQLLCQGYKFFFERFISTIAPLR